MATAHSRMAETLRDKIISGAWRDGSRLETERELCAHYGYSRITVRRALRTLEDEHLIIRRQGVGTFVNVRPRRKIPIVRGDFEGSILKHAPNIKRAIIEQKQCRAGDDLAGELGIPPGETIVLTRRLDTLDDRPVAVDEVAMPLRYADRLARSDWETIDFIGRWRRRQGLTPDYESQTIEAAPADGAIAAQLKVKRGYPLLVEVNFVYLSGGQAAAKFTSYYRHEYYQFNSVDRRIAGQPDGMEHSDRKLRNPPDSPLKHTEPL